MLLTELLLTFVLLDSIQTTVSAKYHGDECSEISSCEVNTYCVLSVNNETRCLCPDDKYRSDRNQCVNIQTLVVQDVRTVKVTSNSVQLSWSSLNVNYVEAKYNVSYEDTYNLGNESGVTIYKLKSETTYNFTIQIILFKTTLYMARYGLPYLHSARTNSNHKKKSHGELCTKGVDTCQTELLCVHNKNQEDRCLCDNNHYWNDHNKCISKSTLTIKTFTAKNISTTSVELSWSIDPLHKSSAQFKVWYGDKNIIFFNSDIMVATIDELKPITVYSFSIKVEIPADKNYNLIEGPPSTCIRRTETIKVTPRTIISTTTLSTTTLSTTTLRSKNKKPVLHDIQFVGHGDLCKLANSTCEPGTSCVETPNKQYRCLCNDLQYWNKDRLCVPLKGLTVTEVQVKKVTSTSVQLSWSNRNIDKVSTAYSVSYRNKSLAAHPGGINITNLQPARSYSFEIFVIIPNELNYKEKRGPGVSISAQTIAEDPNFEKKTPTHQTTTLPTETSSSSKQVLTHTTLVNTASGQSNTNIVIVVIVVLLVFAVVLIVIVVLVVRRKNSKRKSSTQILLDKYDKCRNGSQPELVYTELEPNTYSTSQDLATNTVNATNHNLPTSSNGASSPSVYYNSKAQEEVKVEIVYSHLFHFKEQEKENTENIYDG